MAECIPEDDLLDLASGQRSLAEAPVLEAHLADCPACSGLLCTLIAMPRDARRDFVGRTLGPYRLEGLIGAGAMGEVYRAWDSRLQRHVALKALSAQFADSPDRIRRLEAEARAAAAIAHPNVVTIYDTGSHDGVPFVVGELITGESLRSRIDRGAVDRRVALDLGLQLARGVAAAHAQGVVHRDLKPGNLIVTDDGTLKILDFGLAKVTGDRDVEATEPGTLLGTCGYLSPEQARGEPADARSDIFAIGAILYELVSGRRAFGGATFAERLSGVLRDTPPALDDAVDPVVQRCLDKDPRKRFQAAGDLAWVLQASTDDEPRAPRRSGTISRRTFLVGAAAAGAGGVLLGRLLAPTASVPSVPTYHQLSYRYGRVSRARFTHDGGSILYSALWDELPSKTYTTRVAGGGARELDLPPAQVLAVSSRGQIALSIDHDFLEGFHQQGRLALAPLEGGAPRELGADVQDADFTPDGVQLAVIRRVDGRFRVELPLDNVLFEAGWLANVRVSPDGKFVACCAHAGPYDDQGDIVVIPRDGGAARTVARAFSSIDGIAWAASGRALWISASREGGNNSVRAIALDGRELEHIPSVGRVRVHDLSRGALAVTHTSGRMRMMAKPAGATDEIDLGLADLSFVADISADGAMVLFSEFGDVDTARGIYVRPTNGGAAQRLGGGLAFDLADDGRGVLAGRGGLAVFPIDQGQPRDVALGALTDLSVARWCANGIVVVAAASGRPRRLWRVDGTPAPITEEGVAEPFVVGPDGHSIAMIARDRLHVFDANGGAPRVVAGTFATEAVCGWGINGDIFVRSMRAPIRVRRIDIATGSSTDVVTIAPPRFGFRGVKGFVISERGDAYAYSSSQELSRLFSMTIRTL